MLDTKQMMAQNLIEVVTARVGCCRWTVCALLFCATTINYMDRQVLGLLKPTLMHDLGWSETDFGDIVAAFSFSYALGYVGMGRFMDKVGVKLGLPIAVAGWSLCACLHGLMGTVWGFKLVRGGLGLAEGGNFPASISIIAQWFPPKERALATGLFNAGSNVGAVTTPIILPFIVLAFGWQMAFVVVGSFGFLWVICWVLLYENPLKAPAGGRSRRACDDNSAKDGPGRRCDMPAGTGVQPGVPGRNLSWISLFGFRGTWAFIAGMLMVNSVWWFYLNWIPGYLNKAFGVNMMAAMLPLVAIYTFADVGSVGGGWLSSHLIKRGMAALKARQIALLSMACCVVPVALVSQTSDLWVAVLLIGLASAAHQGFSANLYTIVSDTMPAGAVSSVVGMGGFAGGLMGMVMALAVGRILDATSGNYMVLFAAASLMYPTTVLIVHLILPKQDAPEGSPISEEASEPS